MHSSLIQSIYVALTVLLCVNLIFFALDRGFLVIQRFRFNLAAVFQLYSCLKSSVRSSISPVWTLILSEFCFILFFSVQFVFAFLLVEYRDFFICTYIYITYASVIMFLFLIRVDTWLDFNLITFRFVECTLFYNCESSAMYELGEMTIISIKLHMTEEIAFTYEFWRLAKKNPNYLVAVRTLLDLIHFWEFWYI